MNLDLAGKVVLLTGASGGIGAAVAHALAAEGAQLALQGRSAEKLEALARSLPGGGHRTFALDLAPPEAADALVAQVLAAFPRLDVLVACAGATRGGAFADLDDAAWKANLELKLFATLRTLRAVLPHMRARRSGRIVLVIGNSAREPDPKMLPGAVANAGLLALTRGLALEVAPDGVVINAVNPGPVRSERWTAMMNAEAARTGRPVAEVEAPHLARIPLGRLAALEDVASHVVFLASPAAGHMTGTSVLVDGGAARGIV
jgi:NAD(P)-dependent dehydrogenase (short-subunit alcohol dehydrogenase family)